MGKSAASPRSVVVQMDGPHDLCTVPEAARRMAVRTADARALLERWGLIRRVPVPGRVRLVERVIWGDVLAAWSGDAGSLPPAVPMEDY